MNSYEDIINLPNYKSKTRRLMSIQARAAQFAPFAALTGYEEQVMESSRITYEKKSINNEDKLDINNKLLKIKKNILNKPKVCITYFKKYKKKNGGIYETITIRINKIDEYNSSLILEDNTKIHFDDIYKIKIDF